MLLFFSHFTQADTKHTSSSLTFASFLHCAVARISCRTASETASGKILSNIMKNEQKICGILCDKRNHRITTAITKAIAKNCIGYSMEFLKRESGCYDYCFGNGGVGVAGGE